MPRNKYQWKTDQQHRSMLHCTSCTKILLLKICIGQRPVYSINETVGEWLKITTLIFSMKDVAFKLCRSTCHIVIQCLQIFRYYIKPPFVSLECFPSIVLHARRVPAIIMLQVRHSLIAIRNRCSFRGVHIWFNIAVMTLLNYIFKNDVLYCCQSIWSVYSYYK